MTIVNNGTAEANSVKIDIQLPSGLPAGTKLELFRDGILLSQLAEGGGGTIFSYTDLAVFGSRTYSAKCSSATASKSSLPYNVTLVRPTGAGQAGSPTAPVLTGTSTVNSITLNWNVVSGATSYKIYKDGVVIATKPVPSASQTSFTLTGTNDSTLYTFQVSAVGSTNLESVKSNTFTKNPNSTVIINNAITGFTIVSAGTNYNQFELIKVFADGIEVGTAAGPNLAPLIGVELLNPGAGLLDGTYPWNGGPPNPTGRVVVSGGKVVSTIIDNAGVAFSGPIGPITVNVPTDPAFVGTTVYPSLFAIQGGPIIGAGVITSTSSISYPQGYTPTITLQQISVSGGTGAVLLPIMGQLVFGPPPTVVYETITITPSTIAVGDTLTISIEGGEPNVAFTYSGFAMGVVVGGSGILASGSGTLSASGQASITLAPVTYADWPAIQSRNYRYDFVFAGSGRTSRAEFYVVDPNYVEPPPPASNVGDIDPIKGVVIGKNIFGVIFGPKEMSPLPAPHQQFNIITGLVDQRPGATYPVGASGNVYWADIDMRYANDVYTVTQAEIDVYIAYTNTVPALMAVYRRAYYENNGIIPVGGVIVSPNAYAGLAENYANAQIAPLLAANNWYPPVW